MNNFVLELPEFTYNRKGLFEYQSTIKDWASNIHFMKNGYDTSKVNFYDYYPPDDCSGLLTPIFNLINCKLSPDDVKFSKLLAGGAMPFHIDPNRSAVLMFPLTDNPSKLQWKDSNKTIYEHEYKCTTLINAQILHGVPYSANDRIFLQVRISYDWDYIKNNYKTIFQLW